MKTVHFLPFLFFPICFTAQNSNTEKGNFQLGLRTTVSAFSDDGAMGHGIGGQFRFQPMKRLNTEWFADYITTNIDNIAKRTDYHIGWSVMHYLQKEPLRSKKVVPYLVAGHCFDHTNVTKRDVIETTVSRFSSAIQAGIGTHFNITERMDISFCAQYMMHLGKDVHSTTFINDSGAKDVNIFKSSTNSIEGHLLCSVSINVLVADLMKDR